MVVSSVNILILINVFNYIIITKLNPIHNFLMIIIIFSCSSVIIIIIIISTIVIQKLN